MPLWVIYHPDGTFEDDASQAALSNDITGFYTSYGLPKFFVVVIFIKTPGNTTWVGGEPTSARAKPFIRLAIDHIAVKLPDDDAIHLQTANAFEALLKPHVADKGYDWEWHVTENEKRLSRVNGLQAPEFGSEEAARWAKANRPLPREDESKL
ncbi:putative oxalocrotonate tautomerase [Paraphoma chrysanthemicola]|nr:putative oxalocrotonate tautomerase [Paraphoma chrysanthemicola]